MVVKESFNERESFKCEICDLHYLGRELAEECEKWCGEHDSCNFEITAKSLESKI